MDEIWLKASKRIEDVAILKKRLARQWRVIEKKCLEDIPHNFSVLFRRHSKLTGARVFNTVEKLNVTFEKRIQFVKTNATRVFDFSTQFLFRRWEQLQPRLDNLVTTSFAISTATSTLQLTVQITPILLSALTILATAPMLNTLLPDFLFNSTALFFIMMAISAYAGYSKFKELETRAKLDAQIETTEKENAKQRSQIETLQKRLDQLEQFVTSPHGSAPTFLPLAIQQRNALSQSTPNIHSGVFEPQPTRNDVALKR